MIKTCWVVTKNIKNWNPGGAKLIVVDNAVDASALRSGREGESRHAIIRGYLSPNYTHKADRKRTVSYYQLPLSRKIAIESKYKASFKEFRSTDRKAGKSADDCTPTHIITVSWGKLYEPWISSVRKL